MTQRRAPATSKPVDIRPFREADEAQVVALWRACGLTRPWNDPHRDIARKLAVQRELFLVGEEGGRIVASVDPGRRRAGLGAQLMRRVEELLLAQGCPKINLQVRAGNAEVLAFYRALGYAQDEVVAMGKRLVADH